MRSALSTVVGALLVTGLTTSLTTGLTAGPTAAASVVAPAVGREAGRTDPVTALTLGREAYDYGFPLLETERVRREMTSVACPDGRGNSPVNSFSNVPRFADASARTVVAPNTDTLYSIAHLDLLRGPIVLRHPRMGTRYYSFAMLDPFTDVIATPGTREDGGAAGAIVVRMRGHLGHHRLPRGARVVTTDYRRVWVIGRTLATDARDQRAAYRLMRHYSLTRLGGKARHFAAHCQPGTPGKFPTPTDGAVFVAALDRALASAPPPKRDAPLLARLRAYGVGAGLSPDRAGLDPATEAALYRGVATEAKALKQTATVTALRGAEQHQGWYLPPADLGDYGTDYRSRAQIAALGLGANTPQEAIYPAGVTDSTGVPYVGTDDYRLTFPAGQQPPARYFWSITMYDSDGYLVPNPAGRYSVGPSHPPLLTEPDGSVVIAIQRTRPTDPHVNWLPSPAGRFRLNLRLYGPSRAAIAGVWRPPGVQNLGPAS